MIILDSFYYDITDKICSFIRDVRHFQYECGPGGFIHISLSVELSDIKKMRKDI
jgi:hypothetical protein